MTRRKAIFYGTLAAPALVAIYWLVWWLAGRVAL